MVELPKHKMTADEFLAWSELQAKEAGRFELWDGEVIVRHGPAGFENAERAQHWMVKGALYVAFREAIKRAGVPCHAVPDGAGVRLSGNRLLQPDAMVYCAAKVLPWMLEVPNPVIVAEVLSPGTRRMDLGPKLDGYFALSSILHYLVVDPDGARLIHHRRIDGAARATQIVTGPRLQLDPPGLDVDLSEVLAG